MIIFIPGATPSSKNSKVKTATGVFHSKQVTRYLRSLNIQSYSPTKKIVKGYKDLSRPNLFKKAFREAGWKIPTKRLHLGFHFIRATRHKYDHINAQQIIHDLMVAHNLIEDDNIDWIIPHPLKVGGDWTSYDPEEPGCIIRILDID